MKEEMSLSTSCREEKIYDAMLRQVFTSCDTGSSTSVSSRVQDLEPKAVHIDQNNIAYILFSVSLFHFQFGSWLLNEDHKA